ncbi:TRAP transporter small permease subunit [Aliamphritea spongicola]|nr:TRAP transporter small permease subunit [Aliamphritea spongicola]
MLEELQWHLYAIGVMFGLAYAQTTNSHIRVDLFYTGFRARTKYLVEIFGILFLLLPFITVIFLHSLDFVADAWRINEHSESPSGLPWRWLIKGVIPVSMAMLILAALSRLYRDTVLLFRGTD